jgi:hypothetical protein
MVDSYFRECEEYPAQKPDEGERWYRVNKKFWRKK